MALKEKKCSNCSTFVEYPHKGKPELCPHCSAKYWDKPKDERDLFLLQDIYIENNRDKEYLSAIYEKLFEYSKNIIKHKLRNKKILSEEDFYTKANDIAIIMIERYLKNPTEQINHSFGGMMMWIANGVLFGGKKDDKVDSLNQTYMDSDKEFLDNLYNVSSAEHEAMDKKDPQKSINHLEKTSIPNEVVGIIDMIFERIYKRKSSSNLLYLLGVTHFFSQQKESFIRDFNNLISTSTKRDIEHTKLIIRNYLKEQSYS